MLRRTTAKAVVAGGRISVTVYSVLHPVLSIIGSPKIIPKKVFAWIKFGIAGENTSRIRPFTPIFG
jgi:hypothetical protein